MQSKIVRFVALGALVLLAFLLPLADLAAFAWGSDFDSYILLIPFVSGWLVWTGRRQLPDRSEPAVAPAAGSAIAGLMIVGGYLVARHLDWNPAPADHLCLMTLAILLLLLGSALLVLGSQFVCSIAFPIGFLLFAVPLPSFARDFITEVLQYSSAYVAHGLFWLCGTMLVRDGTIFHLPGFTLQVAPECSGIHSTMVLFITSVLAGYLFLRSASRRAWLAAAVLPLALLRNGIRILIVGELCVHIGPQMIDSYIHRHGGPIFFACSLVPFFYLLRHLRKSELVS